MQNYFNVVAAGDVDSGKSTLIGRFLYDIGSLSQGAIEEIGDTCRRLGSDFEFAYLLDSLEEERKNQLTIDTTQAFCKTKKGREFVFIDVPGHQELLKHMLSGSSYADIAILVVDVQKPIEEQTGRHAFILKFLGIEQIVLVLNKMDSADFNENTFKKLKEKITEILKKIEIQPRCFIPISAKQGENLVKRSKNMPWYKGLSVIEALNTCSKKKMNDDLRFIIQDIYNLNKEKVAVGKIISGKIKKGEKLKVLPLGKEFKVKALKDFNKNKLTAMAPECIGLVLDNMDELRRGQVVCKEKLPKVTYEILAKVFCAETLNIEEDVIFRCLAQETCAKIKQIDEVWDTANLEPKPKENFLSKTDIAQVAIVTESPVVVDSFAGINALGRFVLQNNKEIYAVGIII